MNKIYLSLLLIIIYFGLTVLIFKGIHLISGLVSLQVESFKHFIIGVSVASAAVISLFHLIKRKIIIIQTKSVLLNTEIRITIFIGVILLAFAHSVFSGNGGYLNDITRNKFMNFVLPYMVILPVATELVFRNGIQYLLKQKLSSFLAIFFTSALFGLTHVFPEFMFSPMAYLRFFAVSLILGYSFNISGSIIIPIAISAVYNLFVLIAFSVL